MIAGRSSRQLPSFTPEALPGLNIFARTFFAQLYSRLKNPAVLVFDNYQEAGSSPSFHTLMEMAVGELPAGMGAIIISREPPPEHLARLQVLQALVQLEEAELRFTLQETQALLPLIQQSRQASLSTQEAKAIHARMQGWIAGIVLTLQGANKPSASGSAWASFPETPQMLFEFLAQEVFRKLEPTVQEFLLHTSVLPHFTPAMAQELTGLKDAKALLDQLYRRRYFIERRQQGEETVYQYHPLFREFLEARARRQMAADMWQRLTQQAGKLLEQNGHLEEAWERYAAAGCVDEQIRLILEQAPGFLTQGRGQTLERWIACLPAVQQRSHPWVLYWAGCCAMGRRIDDAIRLFQAAFAVFQQERNDEGLGLAWAGWVEAIGMQWKDLKQLDHLLRLYDETFLPGSAFANSQVQARVTFAQFHACFWRQPEYHKLQVLEKQARGVFLQERNPNVLANQCFILTVYYLWMGKHRQILDLVQHVEIFVEQSVMTPYCRGILAFCKSHAYWLAGEGEQVLREVKVIDRIIQETGIAIGVLTQNRAAKVYAHLLLKQYGLAEEVLRENDDLLTHAPSTIREYHHHQMGWVAWVQGDYFRAKQEVERALAGSYQIVGVIPIALNHICAAMVYQELGVWDTATEHLTKGLQIAIQTQSALLLLMGYLAQAWQLYAQDQEAVGRTALAKALRIGREHTFLETSWFHPRRMAELCVKALEAGIETEYVRYLIQRRDLMPEQPPLHLSNWPWPIRIRTLGDFAIEIQGKSIDFARKMQKRTLALLKALIAARGREVSVENLIEMLWPESDGDFAYNALTTAIYRLRKLLGDDKAVVIQEGKVFLNPHLVWVDVWGVEAQLAKAQRYVDQQHSNQEMAWIERAVNLYQGSFLPADEADQWTKPMRDWLRRSYLVALEKLTQRWVQHEKADQAVQAWERALAREPQDERVYQHLMKILLHVGRWKEAQEVNMRCRTMLNHTYARSLASKIPAIRAPERRQNRG